MLFSFVFFMPVFVCGFFAILLLLDQQGKKDAAKRLLLFYMMATMLLYAAHAVYFSRSLSLIPFTDSLYCFCNPSVFPLYYLYIQKLTQPSGSATVSLRHSLLVLLPAFCCGLFVSLLYIMMSSAETQFFIERYLYGNDSASLTGWCRWQYYVHMLVKVVFAAEIPPVVFHCLRDINIFNRKLQTVYSETDHLKLSHFSFLLLAVLVVSVLSFVSNIIGRHVFLDSLWLLSLPSLTFSVLIFAIGYMGYRQQFSIADLEQELAPLEGIAEATEEAPAEPVACQGAEQVEQAESPSGTKKTMSATVNGFAENLERLMNVDHIYLQPNLKLTDLANRLGTNRSYLYQIINVDMGVSFSEYINRKRVEHAVKLMGADSTIPLTEVSVRSGFSSSVSFYRNFQQFMGLSPKGYQMKLRGKNKKERM